MLTYYLYNSLSYLAVSAISFYAYAAWRKGTATDRVSKRFAMFGGTFLLPMVMNLLWSLSIIPATMKDALFVNGAFSIIASVLFLMTVYDLTGNRHLLYILGLFGVTLLGISYSFANFFIFFLITANLVFLITSMDVLIVKRYHIQLVGMIGSVYSLASLVFSALLLMKFNYTDFLWYLPNLLLAALVLMLHFDKKYYALISPEVVAGPRRIKPVFLGLNFIRYTLYITSITAFTFVATVSVHELGHAVTAYYYNCDHAEIRYDLKSPPFTEIKCASATGTTTFVITLMGIMFALIMSVIFYFTEGSFTTRLAELMAGFGLFIAYHDFIDLGASQSIALLITFVSMLIIIDAVVRFSVYYINEHSKAVMYVSPGEMAEQAAEQAHKLIVQPKRKIPVPA